MAKILESRVVLLILQGLFGAAFRTSIALLPRISAKIIVIAIAS
ncbi:hypothetical protein ACQ4M3_10190 [Leptolyngbya sp. AN03gr2]